MAKTGESKRGAGRGSSDSIDGDHSRARVVQGTSHGASWTSHRIFKEEIEQVQGYFSKVLELPHAMMDDSRRQ